MKYFTSILIIVLISSLYFSCNNLNDSEYDSDLLVTIYQKVEAGGSVQKLREFHFDDLEVAQGDFSIGESVHYETTKLKFHPFSLDSTDSAEVVIIIKSDTTSPITYFSNLNNYTGYSGLNRLISGELLLIILQENAWVGSDSLYLEITTLTTIDTLVFSPVNHVVTMPELMMISMTELGLNDTLFSCLTIRHNSSLESLVLLRYLYWEYHQPIYYNEIQKGSNYCGSIVKDSMRIYGIHIQNE